MVRNSSGTVGSQFLVHQADEVETGQYFMSFATRKWTEPESSDEDGSMEPSNHDSTVACSRKLYSLPWEFGRCPTEETQSTYHRWLGSTVYKWKCGGN